MNIMGSMAAGYTTQQILDFILNSFPHIGQQIHSAKAAGKDIKEIMKFLEPMDVKQLKKIDQQIALSSNPLINMGRATKASSAGVQGPKYAMAAGGLALGAAGAIGLGRMAGQIAIPAVGRGAGAMSPAIPKGLPAPSARGLPNLPGGAAPMQPQGGMPQAPQGGPMGGIPQGTPPIMPQVPTPQPPIAQAAPKINPAELFDTMGIKNHIDNMISAKNPPEVIGGVIKSILHPQQKKFLQQQTQEPLESLIADYMQGQPSQSAMPQTAPPQQPIQPPTTPVPEVAPIEQPIPLPVQKETLPIKKGDQVQTPDGPGLVESKTKDNALVKVDGRVRQYKLDELGLGEKASRVAKSGNEEEQTIFKKKLKDLTYEKTYTGTPDQQHALKVIDRGINKAAQFIVEGGRWDKLLPVQKGFQLSTASDVLRQLAGIPSHYKLLDEGEVEEFFETHQGLTPNIIWNTISLLEPEIQRLKELPVNPKGTKKGKETMSKTDLRRFVSHAVTKLIEKKKEFGPHARMVISAIDAIDLLDFKNHFNVENMTDQELNSLLDNVKEEEIKKFK